MTISRQLFTKGGSVALVGAGITFLLLGPVLTLPVSPRPSPSLPVSLVTDIHTEYVRYASGRDTVTAYLAYPERPDPAPAVIVIHENVGLTDFVRRATERLATDGFVAIAPDLLSRAGGTPASPDRISTR